jgi:hypothetical protein
MGLSALLNPAMKFFRETGCARLSKKFHSTSQQYRIFNWILLDEKLRCAELLIQQNPGINF